MQWVKFHSWHLLVPELALQAMPHRYAVEAADKSAALAISQT